MLCPFLTLANYIPPSSRYFTTLISVTISIGLYDYSMYTFVLKNNYYYNKQVYFYCVKKMTFFDKNVFKMGSILAILTFAFEQIEGKVLFGYR